MLIIKGIFLLLSHLPTSHTTVQAVPHTAVSRFLISRCVASCFSHPSDWRHSYSIIGFRPIVVSREAPFGHLTTKESQG